MIKLIDLLRPKLTCTLRNYCLQSHLFSLLIFDELDIPLRDLHLFLAAKIIMISKKGVTFLDVSNISIRIIKYFFLF